jgi:hypothetical protein
MLCVYIVEKVVSADSREDVTVDSLSCKTLRLEPHQMIQWTHCGRITWILRLVRPLEVST